MKIDITLEEAYARASKGLRMKMEHSINLLQRAEKLALAYDNRGGVFPCFQRRERQSDPLSYCTVGRCTLRGTHESNFSRCARGDPLRQEALSRSGTNKAQG